MTVALARRALVVQRDARALLEGELAAVDRRLAREHPQQRRLARAVAPGDGQPVAALELERDAAEQRLAGDVLAEVGGDEHGHTNQGTGEGFAFACECVAERRTRGAWRIGAVSYDPGRCAASLLTAATVTIVLAAATPALADMSGQGWYGETTDKVVTNFGFILIIFFPLFIFIASLIYWQTDKRKDEKLEAAKARATSSEWKGGW